MMKICSICSGSGTIIVYTGQISPDSSFDIDFNHSFISCRACGGKGSVDPNELITVPRKYVKEEFWKK